MIGIIGGSGLYQIEGFTEQKSISCSTPFGPPSDEIVVGRFGDREVAFLPRHGRGHRIMPSELNHRANIYAMKALGVKWIVSVSAVGSLQPQFEPRHIVLPNQFFDRTKRSFEHTFFGEGIVAHVSFADPIDTVLQEVLYQCCGEAGATVHKNGTYVNMEGPMFSTRAESRANRQLGFDVIGMTNLGEAKLSREAEIAYATVAMVTDYDCWKEDEHEVTVEMVIGNLMANAALAKKILQLVIPRIPLEKETPSHNALANAIITDKKFWPEKTKLKLAHILQKYL